MQQQQLPINQDNIKGSRQLYNEVLGRFRIKGTSFSKYVEGQGLRKQNARKIMLGDTNGIKARQWRQKIVEEARK